MKGTELERLERWRESLDEMFQRYSEETGALVRDATVSDLMFWFVDYKIRMEAKHRAN